MQPSVAVGVLIKAGQDKTGFQLAAHLLFNGMGELDAVVGRPQLFHQLGIAERVKREGMDNLRLGVIHNVIDPDVQPEISSPPGFSTR